MLRSLRSRAGSSALSLRGLATIVPKPVGRGGMRPPLSGIKLLDFTSALSGPSATQYLGDLGADVWKLEVPGKGDDTRSWGPPFMNHKESAPLRAGKVGFESSFFTCVNRNKRSITVDLKNNEGRDIALKLAAQADVIVENLISGKLAAFGLGYEDIKAVNPGVVYCSISGYGQTGPYAKAPGYDAIVAGDAGIIHCTGEPGRLPVRPQVALADHCAGFNAYGAILAALVSRKRSGKGMYLDVSMFDCQVAGLSDAAATWLNLGVEYERQNTASIHMVPDQVFATADGSVSLAVADDRQFVDFADALGRPELATSRSFSTNQARLTNREALVAIIGKVLQSMPSIEARSMLFGRSFAFSDVNNLEHAYKHPQIKARDMISDVPHSHLGTVRLASPPVLYNGERMKTRFAPPVLGQHTATVLKESLAVSEGELSRLACSGATAPKS